MLCVIAFSCVETDATSNEYAAMPVLTSESPLAMDQTPLTADVRPPMSAQVEAADQCAMTTESPLTTDERAMTTENSAAGGVEAAEQSPIITGESKKFTEGSSVTEESQLTEGSSVTEESQLTEESSVVEGSQTAEGSSLLKGCREQ